MRLLLTDWQGLLEDVTQWGQLSIPSRRAFLDGVRPGLGIEAPVENPAISELWEAGFLADHGSIGYLSVDPRFSPFHRLLKTLERIAVFESPGFDILREYFTEHFTRAERAQLHESLAFHPDDFGRISGLVASTDWLEGFLSRGTGTIRGAGRRAQGGAYDDAPRPGSSKAALGTGVGRRAQGGAYDDARQILRFFMDQRDHVPLRDIEEYFPKLGKLPLAAALKLGVQSAVFFLSLRRSDLEPMIGIWPSVARRLKRAEIALVPEPVVPDAVFSHPFLLEDMATILLSANVEPIPARRSDEKPFTRFEEESSASLLSLPAWLEEYSGATPRIRVESALAALRYAGLVRAERDGDSLRFHPSEGSLQWALGGIGERRRAFIDRAAINAKTRRAAALSARPARRGGARGAEVSEGKARPAVLLSLLLGAGASWADGAEELLQPLVQAFASAPRTTFLRFKDFSLYQTAMANPLISLRERGGDSPLWSGLPPVPNDDFLEDLWQSFLHAFLSFGLMALGGADAGRAAGSQPCFMVNGCGRWLLELGGHPEEGGDAAGKRADILVQPTFEVAFLSPSPGAEAEIARFAERTGREVGALFRITKSSMLRAARSGMSSERVIGSLGNLSKTAIPQNVEHEIRDWISKA